jgi:hypothetical protein
MSYEKRTATWCIQKAFVEAVRKDIAPTSGKKFTILLTMLDSEQKNWAGEPGVEWNSLSELVDNGTATSSLTYDLEDTIDYISHRPGDSILVGDTAYMFVTPAQLYEYRYQNAVCQVGQSLKFSKIPGTIGQKIQVPAQLVVDDITKGSDLVQCDDPMYLVYALAANYIRGDNTRSGQYDNLVAKATDRMEKMKQANMGQYETLITTGFTGLGESWI